MDGDRSRVKTETPRGWSTGSICARLSGGPPTANPALPCAQASDRTPQHKATYTFSSDVQSSLSIASASCCRRASSVPTSCPEREGDRLTPGHSSPVGGPGRPRTQDSGSSARGTLLPRGLRQRARGLHPVRSCPKSTHYLPGPFLERPCLSRRSDPLYAGKPSFGHPAPRPTRGRPAQPPHQSETAHLLVGTSLSLRRAATPTGSECGSPAHHTPARIAHASTSESAGDLAAEAQPGRKGGRKNLGC